MQNLPTNMSWGKCSARYAEHCGLTTVHCDGCAAQREAGPAQYEHAAAGWLIALLVETSLSHFGDGAEVGASGYVAHEAGGLAVNEVRYGVE